MNLASKKKSRGDYFFYFFAKKYEKVKKSMKSKHRDLLMSCHNMRGPNSAYLPLADTRIGEYSQTTNQQQFDCEKGPACPPSLRPLVQGVTRAAGATIIVISKGSL